MRTREGLQAHACSEYGENLNVRWVVKGSTRASGCRGGRGAQGGASVGHPREQRLVRMRGEALGIVVSLPRGHVRVSCMRRVQGGSAEMRGAAQVTVCSCRGNPCATNAQIREGGKGQTLAGTVDRHDQPAPPKTAEGALVSLGARFVGAHARGARGCGSLELAAVLQGLA